MPSSAPPGNENMLCFFSCSFKILYFLILRGPSQKYIIMKICFCDSVFFIKCNRIEFIFYLSSLFFWIDRIMKPQNWNLRRKNIYSLLWYILSSLLVITLLCFSENFQYHSTPCMFCFSYILKPVFNCVPYIYVLKHMAHGPWFMIFK